MSSKPKPIQAERLNDVARFSQEDRPVVEPHLVRDSSVLVPTPHGLDLHAAQERLYWLDEAGQLNMPAGLLPRLARELRQQGYELAVDDQSWWQGVVDRSSAQQRHVDNQLVDAVSREPRGLITHAGPHSTAKIVAALADIFPTAKLFVACQTHQHKRELVRAVGKYTDRPTVIKRHEMWGQPRRFYFAAGEFQFVQLCEDFDVIIFTAPECALARRSERPITDLRSLRMYALVPAHTKFDADQQIWLEQVFGRTIYFAGPQEQQAGAIRVEMATLPLGHVQTSSDPLERKSRLFWRNDTRNAAIAKIATAFRQLDMPALWDAGLLLHEKAVFEYDKRTPAVAILVERAEHGRQLAKLLPQWQFMHCVPGEAPPISPRGCMILTTVWAQRFSFHADIILRADGSSSPWRREWEPTTPHAPDEPLLVVDFLDDADDQAVADTRRRLANYRALGWDVPSRYQAGQPAS